MQKNNFKKWFSEYKNTEEYKNIENKIKHISRHYIILGEEIIKDKNGNKIKFILSRKGREMLSENRVFHNLEVKHL